MGYVDLHTNVFIVGNQIHSRPSIWKVKVSIVVVVVNKRKIIKACVTKYLLDLAFVSRAPKMKIPIIKFLLFSYILSSIK